TIPSIPPKPISENYVSCPICKEELKENVIEKHLKEHIKNPLSKETIHVRVKEIIEKIQKLIETYGEQFINYIPEEMKEQILYNFDKIIMDVIENTNLKIEIENLKRQITLADTLIIEININNQRLENEITDLNFKLETYQNSELTNIAYQTEIKELNTTISYLKNELENFKLSDFPIKDKKILEEISKLSNNINTFSDFKKEFENFISNKDKLYFLKFLLWYKLILESFHSYFFWNSCCNIHETKIICSFSNEGFFLYFLEIFFLF
ncbi:44266_t:CDS:2, partial [Gigaspora margarita]